MTTIGSDRQGFDRVFIDLEGMLSMSVRIARVRFSKPTRLYAPANSGCQSALLGTAVALYLNRRLRSQVIHDLNTANYST